MANRARTLSKLNWTMPASRIEDKGVLVGGIFVGVVLLSVGSLFYGGATAGFLVFIGFGLFLISFLNMGIGLVLFVLCILFSPEIKLDVGSVFSRSVLLRGEDFLSIIFVVGWIARLAILREFQLLRRTDLNKPIVWYIAFCVFSTLRGITSDFVSPTYAIFFGLKYFQYFLIFFLVTNYLGSYDQIRRFLRVMAAVLLLFCLYAYWQVPSIEIWSSHRLSAPFAQHPESTSLGGIMALAMGILIAMMIYVRKAGQRFALAMACTLVFIPFLYTLSRTSYVAFAFICVFITLISRNKTMLITLSLFILLSPILLPEAVIDRIAYTWRDARSMGVDPSTQERILVYTKIWGVITDSPLAALMGYGISNTDILDSQYVRMVFESGLIGLFLFLWIMYVIYKTARGVFKRTRLAWVKGFSLGYIAGFLGLLVHGLGAITFTMIRTMETFWFMTGLIFAYDYIMDKVEPEIIAKHPELALPIIRVH